jgi:predicted metal-binding membrane protein
LTPAPVLPPPLARQRNIILATLLTLAVVGWVVFLDQARDQSGMDGMGSMGDMAGEMGRAGPDLTMGGSWPLFLTMWVAMMVAMMFPAAAPMVVVYGRMRRNDPASVALFTGAYIMLWFGFGAGAYLLSAAVESAASGSDWVAEHWGRAGGALLVLAGVYQLTPLKDICLQHCRTPLSFVMRHWRDGRGGAVRMGLEHGVYCVGCCWLLFLVLVPIGVMNVAAMVGVAAVVFSEKVLPRGRVIGYVAAAALVVYGAAVAVRPELLPTVA